MNLRRYLGKQIDIKYKFLIKNFLFFFKITHLKSFLSLKRNDNSVCSFFVQLIPKKALNELTRYGSKDDGGYLLPKLTKPLDCLISPGVGASTAFERAISGGSTRVVLIDGSVARPKDIPESYIFLRKFLCANPKSDLEISLTEIVREFIDESENALQIDIEGAEWDNLFSTSQEVIDKFKTIVIEIHNLDQLNRDEFLFKAQTVLNKLLRSHAICHFHVNNAGGFFFFRGKRYPKVVELSFISNEMVDLNSIAETPHELDYPSEVNIFDWAFDFSTKLSPRAPKGNK